MEHEIEKYPGELRKLRAAAALHSRPAAKHHPAKYTVFWPGQTIHTCQRHFDKVNQINDAIGGLMLDYREEPGNQCGNCVNEAKKEQANG